MNRLRHTRPDAPSGHQRPRLIVLFGSLALLLACNPNANHQPELAISNQNLCDFLVEQTDYDSVNCSADPTLCLEIACALDCDAVGDGSGFSVVVAAHQTLIDAANRCDSMSRRAHLLYSTCPSDDPDDIQFAIACVE